MTVFELLASADSFGEDYCTWNLPSGGFIKIMKNDTGWVWLFRWGPKDDQKKYVQLKEKPYIAVILFFLIKAKKVKHVDGELAEMLEKFINCHAV